MEEPENSTERDTDWNLNPQPSFADRVLTQAQIKQIIKKLFVFKAKNCVFYQVLGERNAAHPQKRQKSFEFDSVAGLVSAAIFSAAPL